jgi:hypothetical protein
MGEILMEPDQPAHPLSVTLLVKGLVNEQHIRYTYTLLSFDSIKIKMTKTSLKNWISGKDSLHSHLQIH